MDNGEKHETIYQKTLNNSIGPNKKTLYYKIHRRVALSVSLLTLLLTFSTSSLIGCAKSEDSSKDSKYVDKYYGYSVYSIYLYENSRAIALMEKYNLTNYTQNTQNGIERRNYNYTADDYKKIKELNETYIHGVYNICILDNVNEVCKALGYADFNDFLVKNSYVNSKGEPSIDAWAEADLKQISEIMKNESGESDKGSR